MQVFMKIILSIFTFFTIKSVLSLSMFPMFDYFVKNNGRQYEGSTTSGSPHACVGKERKFIIVTKPRNYTKKLNPN